jgi:hypothetical protein
LLKLQKIIVIIMKKKREKEEEEKEKGRRAGGGREGEVGGEARGGVGEEVVLARM